MKRINPAVSTNYLLFGDKEVEAKNTVSELGMFGAILGSRDEVVLNLAGGHVLRTKEESVLEGGVLSGAAALDMPVIVKE